MNDNGDDKSVCKLATSKCTAAITKYHAAMEKPN